MRKTTERSPAFSAKLLLRELAAKEGRYLKVLWWHSDANMRKNDARICSCEADGTTITEEVWYEAFALVVNRKLVQEDKSAPERDVYRITPEGVAWGKSEFDW
jgi:hypothetical protein